MSGQSASFLAGGEFLIPVPNGTNDNVTIEYKEFGIRLTLTPTVMNNRRIVLKVAPEVSELDYSAGIQSGGVAVPALRVRRTDTSVMLADGESFVISGLTSSNSVSNVDKFPWLGDIPILGAFFRSTKLDKRRPRAADDRHPAPGPAAGRRRTVAGPAPARACGTTIRGSRACTSSSAASTTASRTTPVCRIRRRA